MPSVQEAAHVPLVSETVSKELPAVSQSQLQLTAVPLVQLAPVATSEVSVGDAPVGPVCVLCEAVQRKQVVQVAADNTGVVTTGSNNSHVHVCLCVV